MKERTFFKIKINIPDLDNYFPNRIPCVGIYKAELVIKENTGQKISLKIFFDSKEYLAYKILRWSNNNDSRLLDKFEVVKVIQPERLIGIDFMDYDYIGITRSTSFQENGEQYFIIRLNGVKKIFRSKEKDISEFYLNRQAFHLVELNYHYSIKFPWSSENYKWEARNNIKDFIEFNEIKFKPEHHFYNSNDSKEIEVLIKKEPKISVNYSGLSEQVIKNHVRLLCVLYSFYSKQTINFSFSRIYTEDKLYIEFRDIENIAIKNVHGIFGWDLNRNPLNLILNVNVPHLLENLEFAETIVERFNYALNTEGESKFMILYNILEQIRNKYILDKKIEQQKAGDKPNIKKVIEEYKFITSKTKTDKFIKQTLEKITNIIADEHKELFQNEIKYKLSPIKVFSMINQFKSLFDYIEIEPKKFGLEFEKLKALRNSIFHGRPVEENRKYLKKVNRYNHLPKFAGMVLLKYFGLNNISEINKLNKL